MGIHEQWPGTMPQPEESKEELLPFGEWEEELNSKENLMDALIAGIKDRETSQEEKFLKVSQLREILMPQLGRMRTVAQKEGEMLDIVNRIKGMLDKGKETLDSVTH